MLRSRKLFSVIFVLSLLMLGSTPSWAGERLVYDEAWWEAQYAKIYDTPQCQEIITNIEKVRDAERPFGTLIAQQGWALALYGAKGECADPAPDQALAIFTDLAERGEGVPAVFLAHFHHIKHGANAPLTLASMERAKHAMPLIIRENWRKEFYQPLADSFQEMGTPFSPKLENIFSWGEEILNGDSENIYQFGVNLLDHGKNSEDKVFGCRWLYKAERMGHKQARYRLARQHILGDGIQQAPDNGSSWLYNSVNKDQNVEALIFASNLLEQGDIFEKHLAGSYMALLRAKSLGADVTNRLERLRVQLTPHQLEWAVIDAKNPKYTLAFMTSPDLKRPPRSGLAPLICKFVP